MRVVIVFLAGLTAFSTGCANKAPGSASPGENGPVIVTVAPPKQQSLKWMVEQPGTLQAFETTPLMAKLPGYVTRVLVDIDDPLDGPSPDGQKPGTLLAEISMPEVREEAKQKEAEAAHARSGVELARKNQAASEAAVNSARATVLESKAREKTAVSNYERWKSESARVDDLVARKVIDKQTADETLNQFRSAEGAWDEAKARTTSADALLKESEAKRDSMAAQVTSSLAKAAATEAEARRLVALLQYAEIRAPYPGVVTGRFVHTGHFLQPSAGRSEPIFTVARTDKVRIAVEVPEAAAGFVTKGTKAKIRFPGLGNSEIECAVSRTSWALNTDSRTLRAEFDLDNPNRKYRPGLYAFATIGIIQPDTWVVPRSAIQYLDDQAYIFLMVDGKAVRYQTQTGHAEGDMLEVIRRKKAGSRDASEPWNGTEQVIVTHQGPLTDGGPVSVK
ncbi:efflux RND transporter periplasmic adaptor subunit [Zavarzinella formosa]|uniref:efflux RND transporter periplasmic adaptor subunit n=1 Tax=Zavarzinella formosa TaxID=360055 RepID=UPI0003185588|nr:efflux RND transporter periplasmic adaptor subunit [Zavarzinella formosa]